MLCSQAEDAAPIRLTKTINVWLLIILKVTVSRLLG